MVSLSDPVTENLMFMKLRLARRRYGEEEWSQKYWDDRTGDDVRLRILFSEEDEQGQHGRVQF
jgi:hypothetical protein